METNNSIVVQTPIPFSHQSICSALCRSTWPSIAVPIVPIRASFHATTPVFRQTACRQRVARRRRPPEIRLWAIHRCVYKAELGGHRSHFGSLLFGDLFDDGVFGRINDQRLVKAAHRSQHGAQRFEHVAHCKRRKVERESHGGRSLTARQTVVARRVA